MNNFPLVCVHAAAAGVNFGFYVQNFNAGLFVASCILVLHAIALELK